MGLDGIIGIMGGGMVEGILWGRKNREDKNVLIKYDADNISSINLGDFPGIAFFSLLCFVCFDVSCIHELIRFS